MTGPTFVIWLLIAAVTATTTAISVRIWAAAEPTHVLANHAGDLLTAAVVLLWTWVIIAYALGIVTDRLERIERRLDAATLRAAQAQDQSVSQMRRS